MRICIAAKDRKRHVTRLNGKESSQESSQSHVGHLSAKDMLSRNAYRFAMLFVVVQGKAYLEESGMSKRKLERRPVVIFIAYMKARK